MVPNENLMSRCFLNYWPPRLSKWPSISETKCSINFVKDPLQPASDVSVPAFKWETWCQQYFPEMSDHLMFDCDYLHTTWLNAKWCESATFKNLFPKKDMFGKHASVKEFFKTTPSSHYTPIGQIYSFKYISSNWFAFLKYLLAWYLWWWAGWGGGGGINWELFSKKNWDCIHVLLFNIFFSNTFSLKYLFSWNICFLDICGDEWGVNRSLGWLGIGRAQHRLYAQILSYYSQCNRDEHHDDEHGNDVYILMFEWLSISILLTYMGLVSHYQLLIPLHRW